MTVRSLDHFRRTRQLFIDNTTKRHLFSLGRHYKTGLLQIGRQAGHVHTANDQHVPLGYYTVRVQDDQTIRDIEVFIDKEGEIKETAFLMIFPPIEGEILDQDLPPIEDAGTTTPVDTVIEEREK